MTFLQSGENLKQLLEFVKSSIIIYGTRYSHSVQMAALCPSFDTATKVLQGLGVDMNHRLLQKLCYHVSDQIMIDRQDNVVDQGWQKSGLRLLVCIDGGRLRARQQRRGRKKKGAKRHGYSTDWIAPWLITIHCIDEKGKILRDVAPIYDGTVKNIDGAFELLTAYLKKINLPQAAALTFCADGGNGIWERVDRLQKTLGEVPVNRVRDYTHAKQNLNDIANLIHQACGVWDYEYQDVVKKLKSWLWKGRLDKIENFIGERLHRKRQKKKALKKLNEYFGDRSQFQYQSYHDAGIPIGSGTVESAIRRVINLRIKSPGQFWKPENAERMIFLRSQVLSGRWESVLNATRTRQANTIYSKSLQDQKMAA